MPPPTPSQEVQLPPDPRSDSPDAFARQREQERSELCVDEPTRWKRRLGRLVDWATWEACCGRSRISVEGY